MASEWSRRGGSDGPVDLLALYRSAQAGEGTTYLLSDSLRIVRINPAWTVFALANGGEAMLAHWGRGAMILDAISEDLREFYRAGFLGALGTDTRWEHDYECSSAEHHRIFRMIAFPIHGAFIAVTHALRIVRPHDHQVSAASSDRYLEDGVYRMCANCRRVHARGSRDRWDWVPEYVANMPPNVSHGLCPPCATLYAS